MKRKIAAIIAADVAGYSRLVAADEENTIRRLEAARAVFDALVVRYGGRIFNTAGDAVLAEFASAVEAVRCGLEIQESLRTKNLGVPENDQMQFRLGINLGDIIERDGDLLGDGVNIAARLEGIAEPGGICISRAVYEQVENKLSVGFASIGPQTVKNIPNPIHAYRVSGPRDDKPVAVKPPLWRQPVVLGSLIAIFAAIGALIPVLLRQGEPPPPPPPPRVETATKPTAVPKSETIAVATPEAKPAPPATAPDAVRSEPAPSPAAAAKTAPSTAEAVAPKAEASAYDPPPTEAPKAAVPAIEPAARPAEPRTETGKHFRVALWCEKLAWTGGQLYQTEDIRLTVRGNAIEYERPIHWPTLQSPVIGLELGKGTIGVKGNAVLETAWSSQRRSFKARYEGIIDANGGTLKGRQSWVSDGKAYERPCSIRLTRGD